MSTAIDYSARTVKIYRSAYDAVARTAVSEHLADLLNPHGVTKHQIGLGAVDNTSDMDKPVSDAQLDAILATTGLWRPGDAAALYGQSKTGAAVDAVPVDPAWVVLSPAGSVLRVDGAIAADPQTIAPVAVGSLLSGRLYEITWRVQRQINPVDPINDSVSLGIAWLNANKDGISNTLVEPIALTVADGVQERRVRIALDDFVVVDHVAPVDTVYFRPYVETHGQSHRTDIILIEARWAAPSGPVTAEGAEAPRSLERRFADTINAADYLHCDGTPNDPADLQRMLDVVVGHNAGGDTQLPGPQARAIYFPGGRYTFTTFQTIHSWGPGTAIFGDGPASQLDGIGFDLHHRHCQIDSLLLMGFGPFGVRTSGDNVDRRAMSHLWTVDRDIAYLVEGHGGLDSWHDCNAARCNVCVRVTECDREIHFTDCVWHLFYVDGVQLWPLTGESTVQGLKFVNCSAISAHPDSINNNGKSWHIKVTPPNGNVFECYIINCTGSTNRYCRPIPFTAVADVGGGRVRFTTTASHGLLPMMRAVEIEGPEYGGFYTVVATPDETHFEIDHTFEGSLAGTARHEGWDIYCDLQGALVSRLHSLFFTGGNYNHSYLAGDNLNFDGVRMTQSVWLQEVMHSTFSTRIFRGRAGDTTHSLVNIPRGGPGAARGWAEIGHDTGNPGTLMSDTNYCVMRSPDPSGGLNGLLPAVTHELRVGHQEIRLHSNAVVQFRNSANNGYTGLQADRFLFPASDNAQLKASFEVIEARNFLDTGPVDVRVRELLFVDDAILKSAAGAASIQARNADDTAYAEFTAAQYRFRADALLKASAGEIQARLNDDSAYAGLHASYLLVGPLPGTQQSAISVGRSAGWLGGQNAHGISVVEDFTPNALAYAAYDDQGRMLGANQVHRVSYQARPIIAGTGTIARLSHFDSLVATTPGQTVNSARLLYFQDDSATATDTIANLFQIYAERFDPAKVTGKVWFIRQIGADIPSWIDGKFGFGMQAPIAQVNIGGGRTIDHTWGVDGVELCVNGSLKTDTFSAGGTIANRALSSFGASQLTSTNPITITSASTVYIGGAPIASTNTTITNPYALFVANGRVYIGDSITIGTAVAGGQLSTGGNQSLPSWGTTGPNISVLSAGTLTDTTSAAAATIAQRPMNSFAQQTLASTNAITVTHAHNLYIAGPPIAGANTTITNPWAIYVANGKCLFEGAIHSAVVPIPAGGASGLGYNLSSTPNFGVFFGSGPPTLVAAKGSLYLRSNGTAADNRAYIATDSIGGWTAMVTAA